MSDWRLNGQEEYLSNKTLYKITFPAFWETAYKDKNRTKTKTNKKSLCVSLQYMQISLKHYILILYTLVAHNLNTTNKSI